MTATEREPTVNFRPPVWRSTPLFVDFVTFPPAIGRITAPFVIVAGPIALTATWCEARKPATCDVGVIVVLVPVTWKAFACRRQPT